MIIPDELIPKKCICTGSEVTQLEGFENISNFSGEGYLEPQYLTDNELVGLSKLEWSNKVRSWVKNASLYHGIPKAMLAIIIQQENGQNATDFQKLGQFVERSIQRAAGTAAQVGYKNYPEKISGGSTGIVNMTRSTLKKAAEYIEENYCKPVLPDSVRYQKINLPLAKEIVDRDVRHAGTSIHVDLYYCAAILRMLIDDQTGKKCHKGFLTKVRQNKSFVFITAQLGTSMEKTPLPN